MLIAAGGAPGPCSSRRVGLSAPLLCRACKLGSIQSRPLRVHTTETKIEHADHAAAAAAARSPPPHTVTTNNHSSQQMLSRHLTPFLPRRIAMMCRIAPSSLAILAVFNVASTLASPVTVSAAWAQHARRLPQNPRTCATACIAAPRPTVPWEEGCAHVLEDSKPPPSTPPSAPSPPQLSI